MSPVTLVILFSTSANANRFGSVGGKLHYSWDINTGSFIFVPSDDDAEPQQKTERKVREVKRQFKDKEDVF